MNANELTQSGGKVQFQQLQTELENIKNTLLEQEEKQHQTSLEFEVRQLRTDINTIMESRSVINQSVRNQEVKDVNLPPQGVHPEERADIKAEYPYVKDHSGNEENILDKLKKRIKYLELQRTRSYRPYGNNQTSSRNPREDRSGYSRHSRRHGFHSRKNDDLSEDSDSDLSERSRGSTRSGDNSQGRGRSLSPPLSDSDQEDRDATIPFYSRVKGPRYMGLQTIKPSDETFDRLLNYRYYRLQDVKSTRSARSMLDVSIHLKILQISMKDYIFSGSNSVEVLRFLTRFVEEADTLRKTEAQALVVLPKLMKGTADTRFRASRNGARAGGITAYPEAIQFFLRTYATPSVLREAVNAVRNINQSINENELEYGVRIDEACDKCGNAFTESQKITFYVNGLLESIRTDVANYRESQSRDELKYQELVSKAKDYGDSHRAKFSGLRVLRTKKQTPLKRGTTTRSANILDIGTTSSQDDGEEDILILPEDSVPTSELPSTLESEKSSEQLLLTGYSRTSAAPIAYGGNATPNRVGWVNKQPIQRQRIICYLCYTEGHTSPQCTAKVTDMNTVVKNYEALSTSERERVPHHAHIAAKTYIEMMEAAKLRNDNNKEVGQKDTSQSKN